MSRNGKEHGDEVDERWRTEADPAVHRLFGFLLGSTTAGAAMYYYVVDEYRISNELLTEDIYVRHLTL